MSDAAAAYTVKAQVLYRQGRFDAASEMLNEAAKLSRQTYNATDRLQIYRYMFLIDSARHNYEGAFTRNYLYNKLNDSLVNISKNQTAALFNVKFDSQRRDDENKQLRIAEEKNRAIIGKQHIIQAALVMGLLFICLGFIYFQHINNQVKARNKIIAEQNLVLENSNVVKDKLFTVISHDLRSPITQLVSAFTLWERGELDKDEIAEIMPVIRSDIKNTLELLDNLLIWSKNQLQGFNFSPEAFDMHQLAAEDIGDLKEQPGCIRSWSSKI